MIRECLNDWVFIAKVPISRLDDYLFGRDAAAPDDLRAGYSTDSLEPTTTAVVSTEPGIRGNPRKTRRMSWKLINPEKCNLDKVVLKETLFCNGKCECTPPVNPINKKMRCEVVLRWEITAKDLYAANIWRRGSHGPNYRFNPKAVWMAPEISEDLLKSDGLDVSSGGNTTAGREVILLQERAMKMGLHTRDVAPTRQQVANKFNYERCKAYRGKGTIVQCMQEVLVQEHLAEHVLYPGKGDRTILQVAREKEPFLLIFISKNIGRLVHEYGQKIIGLDGIYKWNRMRWPVWIMVVEDKKGHSWPIAFFFAAADTAAILYKALQILHKYVEEECQVSNWKPTVMIDKDKKERAAIASMGWKYLLCQFHLMKTWTDNINDHCRSHPGMS